MRRSISRLSVLLPVWFGIYLLNHSLGNDIYFAFINLTIWSVDFVTAFFVFTILWVVLSPLAVNCCTSWVYELAIYFFPVGLWSTLCYAQNHFFIVLCGVIVFLGLAFLVIERINKTQSLMPVPINNNTPSSQRIMKQRLLLIIVCCLFLPPFFDVLMNDGTNFKGLEAVNNHSDSDVGSNSAVLFSNADKELKNLPIEEWADLTDQQRIDVLQIIVNYETSQLGIPPTAVSTKKHINADTFYDQENNIIYVDPEMLAKSSNKEKCIETTLWSLHIKYIYFLVEHADFESVIAQTEYFKTIRIYKDNLEHYIYPSLEGYEAYANQEIVRSSTIFAETETQNILDLVSNMSS